MTITSDQHMHINFLTLYLAAHQKFLGDSWPFETSDE